MASSFALFNLGFRAFFLGAGTLAVATMLLWAGVYHLGWPLPLAALTPMQWHAHEMIYGYSIAVVAGFLLTAAGNWTGTVTARGAHLAALLALWLAARIAFSCGAPAMLIAGICDIGFAIALLVTVARPIVRARQWRQAGVLAKLTLLGAGNAVFYAGVGRGDTALVQLALVGGLYLLVSLILTIGARVAPGFIGRGVAAPVRIQEPRWITPACLGLFLVFFVAELSNRAPAVAAACAGALFTVLCVRLWCWHTPGLWRKPLLWGLYLAVAAIAAGFLLRALAAPFAIPPTLPLHLFAVGGIGLATLSMMARVALGHSGRSIHEPPATVGPALALLVAAAVVRVGGPLLAPAHYAYAIGATQALWCVAFLLFLVSYAPLLVLPGKGGPTTVSPEVSVR